MSKSFTTQPKLVLIRKRPTRKGKMESKMIIAKRKAPVMRRRKVPVMVKRKTYGSKSAKKPTSTRKKRVVRRRVTVKK